MSRSQTTLWMTLIISLVVHGLLLAMVWYQMPKNQVVIQPVVQKQLIQLMQQAPPKPQPAPPVTKPSTEPISEIKSKPQPKPRADPEPKPAPKLKPQKDITSEPSSRPVISPAPPVIPQPVVAKPTLTPQQIRQLLTLKQQYLDDVRAILIENRFYPRKSQRRKHQDRVLVSFVVQADGRLTDVSLEQPSRYDQLNEASLQLFKEKVKRVAPIPTELNEDSIQSNVWIEYKL